MDKLDKKSKSLINFAELVIVGLDQINLEISQNLIMLGINKCYIFYDEKEFQKIQTDYLLFKNKNLKDHLKSLNFLTEIYFFKLNEFLYFELKDNFLIVLSQKNNKKFLKKENKVFIRKLIYKIEEKEKLLYKFNLEFNHICFLIRY